MSVIANLLSGGAAKLVESVGGVLDNLTTSKEEKLAAEAKIKDLVMGYEAEMQKAQDEYDAEMNKAMKEYDAEMQKAMDEIDGM